MSIKLTVIAAVAGLILALAACVVCMPNGAGGKPPLEWRTVSVEAEFAAQPKQGAAITVPAPITESMMPAAPAGERISDTLRFFDDEVAPAICVPIDQAAMAALGSLLESELGYELRRETRRNAIERVLTEECPISIVTVRPSDQERRMGAHDIVLGYFEPILIVARENPWRVMTRKQAQALLAGRAHHWPASEQTVTIYATKQRSQLNLFSELLIPGDVITATEDLATTEEVIDRVAADPGSIGITHRAGLRADDEVQILEIEGFRPRLEIRAVFRNEYHPTVARFLRFLRSEQGRADLGQLLRLR